jgi:hypothetical protein
MFVGKPDQAQIDLIQALAKSQYHNKKLNLTIKVFYQKSFSNSFNVMNRKTTASARDAQAGCEGLTVL